MRIGVLSYRPLSRKATPEEIDLKNCAKELGHTARIFRASKFQMVYDNESPWLLYDGRPFPDYDVVITRPSVIKDIDLHIALIKQMEMAGVLLFNGYQSILNAKNKIRTMQILDHYGIPIPKSVFLRRSEDVADAAKTVGGFPLIIKTPFGSFGNGVTIVESMRALNSFLRWDDPGYLVQEFVKYTRGKDLRIFVVNGKVVGSMERSAKKGEFRANIELGAIGSPVEITNEESMIALRCVQALDLSYGGVDVIRGKDGPVVLEVNSNPGFKELQNATGVNIARAIVEHGIELAERHKRLMFTDVSR
ncbi:MAG: RimK family alpha-L-glutamate ligase [Candidatus Gracilibacteria bacterium]|jgi:ribosomal protein S6--L-glutamate ligase